MDLSQAILQTCDEPLPDLSGRYCHAGLDYELNESLRSLYLCFPFGYGQFAFVGHNFANKQARDLKAEPYFNWLADGRLWPNSGWCETNNFLVQSHDFTIKSISVDAYLSGEPPYTLGAPGPRVKHIEMRQIWEAHSHFIRLLKDGRIVHGGDPILEWSLANVNFDKTSTGALRQIKKPGADSAAPFAAAMRAFAGCIYAE
ncbi:terminase [Schlesneria paludicola]|uniref:terminase n=1 Tax=Schlesneria paludicola TaxID=360056 RepID=UPI00029ABEC8|nr:terminase [Schlesneria paludicola]